MATYAGFHPVTVGLTFPDFGLDSTYSERFRSYSSSLAAYDFIRLIIIISIWLRPECASHRAATTCILLAAVGVVLLNCLWPRTANWRVRAAAGLALNILNSTFFSRHHGCLYPERPTDPPLRQALAATAGSGTIGLWIIAQMPRLPFLWVLFQQFIVSLLMVIYAPRYCAASPALQHAHHSVVEVLHRSVGFPSSKPLQPLEACITMEQLAVITLGFAGTTALAYYTELCAREFLQLRVHAHVHAPPYDVMAASVCPNWLDGLTSFVIPLLGALLAASSFVR